MECKHETGRTTISQFRVSGTYTSHVHRPPKYPALSLSPSLSLSLWGHPVPPDKVALKILDKTRMDVQAQRQLAREIANTERLQHPNVVRLYEVVETPCRLYLVLEYAGGGDLHTRICDRGKMAADCCKVAFAQILFAIKYLVRML